MKYSILIVDDEPLIRESLYEIFRIDGYRVHMAQSGEDAIPLIDKEDIDIVVTDMKLPRMNGIELLSAIKKNRPDTEVILITGYGSIESAVEAMKKGAYDYITKPINDNEIKIIIGKITEKKEILEENRNLKEIIAQTNPVSFGRMIGRSEKMQKVYHIIESVASSNATILITGESGTGKGMVARAIHENDRLRKDKPFVEISCGALSETLLESELFGHVKGAFTGAIKDKEGRFEFAKHGTIFLDEIDAFSLNLQVKLLRVLQDGVFERVGDNITRKTDARMIVATNRNLPGLVEKGGSREDLYYRINVISIQLPSLKERKEDLPLLTEHFIKIYSKDNHKNITGISDEVQKMFMHYHWPGNIREFENAIEGAVIMAKTSIINKEDLPNAAKFSQAEVGEENVAATIPQPGKSLKEGLEEPERALIISVLKECHWNRNKAATALKVNRTTLYNKMKKYDISFEKPKK
jgi:DNA-binding NtrC family response regulator